MCESSGRQGVRQDHHIGMAAELDEGVVAGSWGERTPWGSAQRRASTWLRECLPEGRHTDAHVIQTHHVTEAASPEGEDAKGHKRVCPGAGAL